MMIRSLSLLVVAGLLAAAVQAQEPTATPQGNVGEAPARPSYVLAERPCADAKNFLEPGFQAPEVDHDAPPDPGANPDGPTPAEGSTPRTAVVADLDGDDEADRLDFYFDSTAGLVRYEYRSGAGGAEVMAVQFEGVFEYRDDDGDGGYDPGEPVLQEFLILPNRLHHADWWTGPCGTRLLWTYYLTATMQEIDEQLESGDTAGLEAQPRMALQFTHLQEQTTQDGLVLRPQRVKADISVERFPFTEQGSRIGVRSWASAEGVAATGNGEPQVQGGKDGLLVYRWVAEAMADGSPVAVTASTSTTDAPSDSIQGSAVDVVFSYPQAASLLHDPELGLNDLAVRIIEALRKGDPIAYAAGFALAILLLGVGGLGRRKA